MTEPEDPFYRLQPGETLHIIRGYHLDYILLYTPIIHEFVCKKAGILFSDMCVINIYQEGFVFCVIGCNRRSEMINLYVNYNRGEDYFTLEACPIESDKPLCIPFILDVRLDLNMEQAVLKEIRLIIDYEINR